MPLIEVLDDDGNVEYTVDWPSCATPDCGNLVVAGELYCWPCSGRKVDWNAVTE